MTIQTGTADRDFCFFCFPAHVFGRVKSRCAEHSDGEAFLPWPWREVLMRGA